MRTTPTAVLVSGQAPADWDTWTGPFAPTLRRAWLELAAHRLPGGLVVCATRAEDGRLRAAIGGTLLPGAGPNRRLDPYHVLSGASRADDLLADGPHPWAGRPAGELFPCLHLMLPNYETTVLGAGRHDPKALDELCAGVESWARDQGCRSVAATYLLPEPAALPAVLRRRGWFVAPLIDRWDLTVAWGDFAGYLRTLPSRRRVAVRRELRELAECGVRLTDQPLAADDLDDLVGLRLRLLAKYGQPGDREREHAVLRRLLDHFPATDLTVVQARAADRLVGFTLLVRDGTAWTALMTGTDYSHPASAYCYFATCYYEPARLAPERGVTTIAYGMGSSAAKRRRGCRPTTLLVAAKTLEEAP